MPKRTRSEEVEQPEKKVSLSACPSEIDSIRRCQDVYRYNRLLESRSACIYEYLVKLLGEEKVFSTYLTLPIVLSFATNQNLVEEAILQVQDAFIQGVPLARASDRDKQIALTKRLLKCNLSWNEKLIETKQIQDSINIRLVRNENGIDPYFVETVRCLMFLQQIMGVIDKPTYQEAGNKYFNITKHSLGFIDSKKDNKCNMFEDEDKCSRDKDCVLRVSSKGDKNCINRERIRTTTPNKPTSYYILEDSYTDTDIVYVPLFISKIISGYSGVFEQFYSRDSKTVKANKYTIAFPPFGGKTFQDNFNGFRTFYIEAYIQSINARASGNAPSGQVGIITGLYKAVMSWYNECKNIIATIPKDADIYICGCSLGGALSNVTAFFLLQLGYTKIHLYAMGSPRVGDVTFVNYMEKSGLMPDSANYVRFNNVIKNGTFYTEFDPVAKFPINSWSLLSAFGMHLRYANNPHLRCMGAGLTFNPVLGTFLTQPEFDFLPGVKLRNFGRDVNAGLPIDGDCEDLFFLLHSIPAYSANNFVGARDYEVAVPNYRDYFDHVIDVSKEKCREDAMEE